MYNSHQLEIIVPTNHVKYMHADVSECACVFVSAHVPVYIQTPKMYLRRADAVMPKSRLPTNTWVRIGVHEDTCVYLGGVVRGVCVRAREY